jgi:predicted O-linked N-acetylglucosamine transferase (SPINDLY family)
MTDVNHARFQEAVRQHQANRLAEAAALYQQVLSQQPEHASARYLFGMLLKQFGRDDDAITQLQHAIAADPGHLDSHQALGNVYLKLARTEDAMGTFSRALQIRPGHFAALNGLGLALTAAGRLPEAIAVLRRAIESQPLESVAHFNLGVAYQKQGLHDAAEAAYQRALTLKPEDIEAQFNLGVLYREKGLLERAAACCRQVLQLRQDFTPAYYNLGAALYEAGKIDAWLENFRQFQNHTAPSAMLAVYGLQACQYLGEIEPQQTYLDELLDEFHTYTSDTDAIDRLEETLPLLLYFDFPQERLLALYQHYNQLCKRTYQPRLTLPPRVTGGKIRLGYLSADLRDHVMGKMMYQAISRHDRNEFEVHCFSLSPQQDAWTENFRAVSDQFVDLANLDPHSAAVQIAENSLDILVDLSTHTKGAVEAILAFKPARVQITHIASAGAVGLDSIDFRLTDHYADTPANQATLLERLLPMEGCVFPYRHIEPASSHEYQRNKLGISKQAVVLGTFVNLIKLSSRCLTLWRRVLEALPDAVLAFSPLNQEAQSAYLRRLEAAGIAANRAVFVPPGEDEAHNQARYAIADMALDTLPYGGVNGTLEALDMGVPVVTLCGERHGERTSYSILTNLGVTDTIAHSEQEFVDIAVRLARDAAFRTSVTQAIRRGLADSPLVNMDAHTRHLEGAYREALKHIVSSP